jgi:hypothetical protein
MAVTNVEVLRALRAQAVAARHLVSLPDVEDADAHPGVGGDVARLVLRMP